MEKIDLQDVIYNRNINMKNIIEARELPEDERVYLKKGFLGWDVVQPVKNENGTTNWLNLLIGGWGNLFKLLFILLVIFSFLYGVNEMMRGCNDMAKNPCKYTNLDCTRYYKQSSYMQDYNEELMTDEQLQRD